MIIGDPPFVEYTNRNVNYSFSMSYSTESCGNLYAFISERCGNLASNSGSFSFILPAASCCTPRMKPLMSSLLGRYQSIWVSLFDERPSKLFDGVDQQLAIHLAHHSGPCIETWITSMRHWSTQLADERPNLFKLSWYQGIDPRQQIAEVLPKMGTSIEAQLLRKVLRTQSVPLNEIARQQPAGTIYYRNAGGRYWRLVKSFPTYFSSESGRRYTTTEKELVVGAEFIPLLVCVYSSSTFYWFWRVISNCRHLTNREFNAFPIDSKLKEAKSKSLLNDLYIKFELLLKETKVRVETNNLRSGITVQDRYHVNTTKHLLDDVDRVLAKHYGFTDEELDFIINYDIKYRMGLTAEISEDD